MNRPESRAYDDYEAPSRVVGDFVGCEFEVPNRYVLDASCGSGNNAIYFARHGYNVLGLDDHPEKLGEAQRRLAYADILNDSLECTFTKIDLDTIHELDIGVYGVVTANKVLHARVNPDVALQYLRALQDCTAPGGYHVMSEQLYWPGVDDTIQAKTHLLRHNEYRNFYLSTGWHIVRYCEEMPLPTKGDDIVPAQVRIIAQKRRQDFLERFTRLGLKPSTLWGG